MKLLIVRDAEGELALLGRFAKHRSRVWHIEWIFVPATPPVRHSDVYPSKLCWHVC
jgi:hypothetical protein